MNRPFPPLLYLAGTQDFDSIDAFERHLRTLLDAGLPWFQLRDKRLDDRSLALLADRVRLWTRESGTLFTLNDRPDIALLCEADGVHLGQEDLSALEEGRSREERKRMSMHLGISTHNKNEVLRALTHHPDYLGVGPIFSTTTKETGVSPRGVAAITETRELTTLPLVAIGGITLENGAALLAEGARTLAVSSLLTQGTAPEKILKAILVVKTND
ncbi:MAG: thiamine phosphate synthase [Leptospirillia bacterium]